jgi:geranylgeranyl diphosphate synthase type II
LALAFEVLAKGVRPPETAAACCAALAEAAGACHLVGGQADDLAGGGSRGLDLLESIHHRKTGAMIVVSLRMGAMIARADRTATVALERYGRALGLTFQITDDLLDIRGVQEEVGKRVGKDRDHGKLTFPAVLGIERSASRAAELTEEACAALGPLGGRGSCLEALARCVLERNR